MSQAELDDLFRKGRSGEIPDGDSAGTAIAAPGTEISGPARWLIRWLAWRGKIFSRARGDLFNKVSPLNIRAFRARVYRAPSWYDGADAIILDYSQTSLLARRVRDEIREISPGTYLGIVYWGRIKTINFVLEFATSPGA
jgi:hypothetical protein